MYYLGCVLYWYKVDYSMRSGDLYLWGILVRTAVHRLGGLNTRRLIVVVSGSSFFDFEKIYQYLFFCASRAGIGSSWGVLVGDTGT